MYNPSDYLPEANRSVNIITDVLRQRNLAPSFSEHVVTGRGDLVVMFSSLDLQNIQGGLEAYLSQDLMHHLSTALGGKYLLTSNHTGLRYVTLLSKPPELPTRLIFPQEKPPAQIYELGVDLYGPIRTRLLRNFMVAGEPGSGKSNFLLCLMLIALLHGTLLFLADPDGHTFNPDVWDSLAAASVAQSAAELRKLLELIEAEIARRAALYRSAARNGQPPADLDAYNQIAGEMLPYIMLVIDEANSYFDHKDLLEKLQDLARRGRKWGLVLILAAHNWRAKDVSRALSAMIPNRVCFRVSDDSSGTVVLNSRIWGKRAMALRHPGRGILLLDGRYRVFQAYWLPEDRLNSLAAGQLPAPLSDLERSLVGYALEHLDGRFIVNQLAQAFAGQGVSHHQVQKLAEQFERRGWLTQPAHATDARRLTTELSALAGHARTGVQVVQERTGAVQDVQG